MRLSRFGWLRVARNAWCALGITAVASVGAACVGSDDRDHDGAPESRVLARSLSGQPGSLDPQKAEDAFSYDVLRDLYEGLTTSTPDGEVAPAAASSWKVSEGGRRYQFQLRHDARWSNGDRVKAQDFVAGFRRAFDAKTSSGATDLLGAIENGPAVLAGSMPPDRLGVRALSDSELEIRLSRPVAYFVDILTNPVASPVHPTSLAQVGFASPGKTVSNGPYVLAAVSPTTGVLLRRNPHYWDRDNLGYDQIRYEFMADQDAEYLRFRAGDIDVTNSVPDRSFQELQQSPESGLQHRAMLATLYFTFNTARGPLRDRPGVREALSLVIDRELIASAIARAGQMPAYALVPDGTWNYSPQAYGWKAESRERRRMRARSLYAAAGYSAANPLRIRLLYNQNDLVGKVCLAVAAMWKEALGVETTLDQMEFKAYLAARADPDQWDVVRVGWSADYNDASAFLDTMSAGSPQNFGRWSNERYSQLLSDAADATDPAERRGLLQQAESLMLADYPLLPVYFYVAARLVQPGIAAPAINPMFRTYSKHFRPAPAIKATSRPSPAGPGS